MKPQTLKGITFVLTLGAIMFLGACHKKTQPAPPPPPPPPPPTPSASLSADPSTIEKGQSTTLTWQSSNATDATIDGIGAVQPNGSQQVSPPDSTTYSLTVRGPGGTQTATTRVTVTAPPPPPPPPGPTDEELFAQNVKDVYFDYDKADIRADQQGPLQGDIAFLTQHPNIHFTIEGHCDERGSIEYNLALGDKRAQAVENALTQGGISSANIKTISYGKEKPFCTESNEGCWSQNRRGHFVYQK